CVRVSERRGDCDCGSTEPSYGGNDCPFRVRAAVDRDGLAVAKTNCAGDRDYGGAQIGGDSHGGGACRTDLCDDNGLTVRACINRDLLANIETLHTGNFDVGCSRVCGSGKSGGGLCVKVSAVAVCVSAVREATRTLIRPGGSRRGWPKAASRTRCKHVTATLLCAGGLLITLCGPGVDETAIIEAVDNQISGVSEHHA